MVSPAMVRTNDDCGARAERDATLAVGSVFGESQADADVIETEEGANVGDGSAATDVVREECGNGEAWETIKRTASADEPHRTLNRRSRRRVTESS